MARSVEYSVTRRNDDSTLFDDQYDELRRFFRDAYGVRYNGDDKLAKKFGESDTCASLRFHGEISAVALSSLGRITTIGTASGLNDILGGHSRFTTMINLLTRVKLTDGIDWISVGVNYDRMSSAVALAGMKRANCRDNISRLLDSVGESDRYTIRSIEGSSVIIKGDYVQKVYVKEGCDHDDNNTTDESIFE